MKKVLIVAAMLVVTAIYLINAKTDEAKRNKELGQACFEAACGGRGVCSEAVATLYPDICFNGAYQFSLAPGADTLNLETLLGCMNKTIVSGNFEIAATAAAAPLTFPVGEPQAANAGIVFAFDDEKVKRLREQVRTGMMR